MVAIERISSPVVACEREPIHLPGAIQPHGFLVALDEESLRATYASANVEQYLHRPVDKILDQPAADIFGPGILGKLDLARQDKLFARKAIHLKGDSLGDLTTGRELDLVAHRRDGLILLEGETVALNSAESILELHARLEPVLDDMERAESVLSLCQQAAVEVRQLTGFDRVLIYQFDVEWNGRVIAEDRNEFLPSYLDLRFPAEDIPRQARELYRLNRLRLIVSADYQPVSIIASPRYSRAGQPLDLSLSTLRSVSPVHLQYMRNMGTASSMSISIIRNDTLWGLISCHHHQPRSLSFARRAACELLGQVFSLQLTAREQNDHFSRRVQRQGVLTTLLAKLSGQPNFVEALGHHSSEVMALVGAQGFAILHEKRCVLCGETPLEDEVKALGEWLGNQPIWEVFHSDSLSREFSPAANYSATASGLLAVSVSRVHTTYVLWFRPEVVETVTWGGDPRKTWQASETSPAALTPRSSFEAWKQVVRARSVPWLAEDVEVASEFRQAIVSVVLKRAEEMAALAEELTKANRELAAFSYSVSHDLRAPFRHIRSYAEILREEKQANLDEEAVSILDRILDASHHAGKLVDNLLAFAQMGRTAMKQQPVDMDKLVEELRDELMDLVTDRKVEWSIAPLPKVKGDLMLLRQVWQNLFENALKYSRTKPVAQIKVTAEELDGFVHFHVKDNGVGFDPRYTDKLFGVFQRLHRTEDFEGTGIGLANVRRIVERHGGKTWADGKLGEGATFSFSLPMRELTFDHA